MIEFHKTTFILQDLKHPDQLIFDFGPSDSGFEEARHTAVMLQEFLAESEIPSFSKTSGGRDMHPICPIEPLKTPEAVVYMAKP